MHQWCKQFTSLVLCLKIAAPWIQDTVFFWYYFTIINCLIMIFEYNYYAQQTYAYISKYHEHLTDWSISLSVHIVTVQWLMTGGAGHCVQLIVWTRQGMTLGDTCCYMQFNKARLVSFHHCQPCHMYIQAFEYLWSITAISCLFFINRFAKQWQPDRLNHKIVSHLREHTKQGSTTDNGQRWCILWPGRWSHSIVMGTL